MLATSQHFTPNYPILDISNPVIHSDIILYYIIILTHIFLNTFIFTVAWTDDRKYDMVRGKKMH